MFLFIFSCFLPVSCYHLPNISSGVIKIWCCLLLQGQQDLTYSVGCAAVYHSAYSAYVQHGVTCVHSGSVI